MVINAKCNDCKEPTKYVVGFFDGRNDIHGCLYGCHNEECEIKQIMEASASKDIQEMERIQLANGDKGMYAEEMRKCPCLRWHRLPDAILRNTAHTSTSGKSSIRKCIKDAKSI